MKQYAVIYLDTPSSFEYSVIMCDNEDVALEEHFKLHRQNKEAYIYKMC